MDVNPNYSSFNTPFNINDPSPNIIKENIIAKEIALKSSDKKETEPHSFNKLKGVICPATAMLPFSSRGIVINVLKTPIRLFQSLHKGIVAIRNLQAGTRGAVFKDTFTSSIKAYARADWIGGISDYYKRINSSNGKEIVKENLPYACCLYGDWEQPASISGGGITPLMHQGKIRNKAETQTKELKSTLDEMTKKFEALGFKKGENNSFYHEKTGTCFTLTMKKVKDSEKFEIVLGFFGIGNEKKIINPTFATLDKMLDEIYANKKNPNQTDQKYNDQFCRDFLTKHGYENYILTEDDKKYFNNLPNEYTPNEKKLFVLHKKLGELEVQLSNSATRSIGKNFFGGVEKASLDAIALGKILNETCGQQFIPVVVGHSHGGGLAQCAAAANGIKGVVFNSRPMGASMRRYIGQAKIAENAKEITAFSIKGDYLTGSAILNVLSAWAERLLGIPLPRTVAGNAYTLPPKAGCNSHANFIQAMVAIKR